MKTKIFTALIFSIFALVLFISSVSATPLGSWDLTTDATGISNTNLVATDLTVSTGILDFDIVNGTLADNWTTDNTADANGYYEVTITPNQGYNFKINSIKFDHIATDTMNFVVRSSEDGFASDLAIAGASTTTSATATVSPSQNLIVAEGETITFRIYGYNAAITDIFSVKNLVISGELIPEEAAQCITNGNNLKLDDIDLSVEDGIGDDEEWFPLDKVLAETRIEYDGDDDSKLDDIEIVWGLFNRDTNRWYIDDDEKVSDIDGGEREDIVLSFKLDDDIDDLEEDDLVFYVIATGEDEGIDQITCVYETADVSMQIEEFLILYEIVEPESVQCSADALITADIWNIGDNDEEDVYILVYNKDLGILNERIELGDMDAFDNFGLNFPFTIPKNADEKIYPIRFSIYDEDDDLFENGYNGDESRFDVLIKVEGSCVYVGEASVSANLEAGEIAGDKFIVKTTITNSGDKEANYIISAKNYNLWAFSASISESAFTLAPGESKEITITLRTKESVSGEQEFNIEVLSGNEIVITQPVSVLVEEKKRFLSAITGRVTGGSTYTWTIGTISVFLFIAIIYVVIKMFRRRKVAVM